MLISEEDLCLIFSVPYIPFHVRRAGAFMTMIEVVRAVKDEDFGDRPLDHVMLTNDAVASGH